MSVAAILDRIGIAVDPFAGKQRLLVGNGVNRRRYRWMGAGAGRAEAVLAPPRQASLVGRSKPLRLPEVESLAGESGQFHAAVPVEVRAQGREAHGTRRQQGKCRQ